MQTSPRFGVFLPQGWHAELIGVEDPARKYEVLTSVALEAESADFNSIWLLDHLQTAPSTPPDAVFECWTTLAGLARDTHRIRLGHLVNCVAYRNPALLAKMGACVDVMSGGRLILGVGAGWYEPEYLAFGYSFPPTSTRLAMLREAVMLIKAMWTSSEASFEGSHFRVRSAQSLPQPIQEPHPAIWIGGMGERVTLRIVAELGDACNLHGPARVIQEKLAILEKHCKELGRNYDSILKTVFLTVVLGNSSEVDRVKDQVIQRVGSVEVGTDGALLTGDEHEIARQLRQYTDLGVTDFVLYVPHAWEGGHLTRIREQVMPLVG